MEFLAAHSDVKLKYIVLTHHHYDHSSRRATAARGDRAREIVMHVEEEKWLLSPGEETGDFEIPEDQKEAREQAKKWREEAAKAIPDIRVEDNAVIKVGGITCSVCTRRGTPPATSAATFRRRRCCSPATTCSASAPPRSRRRRTATWAQYIASLKRMRTVDAELLLPGHGPVVKEPQRKIQELIDHRQQREDQILRLLADGRDSVKSLVKAIYPELDKRLLQMATGQVLSHLHKLQSDGRVTLAGKGAETTITSTSLHA